MLKGKGMQFFPGQILLPGFLLIQVIDIDQASGHHIPEIFSGRGIDVIHPESKFIRIGPALGVVEDPVYPGVGNQFFL